MPANTKGTKGLGKSVFDILGLLSYLLGSFILLTIAFGTIGGIFISTKRLFQLERVKKDENNSHTKPEEQTG